MLTPITSDIPGASSYASRSYTTGPSSRYPDGESLRRTSQVSSPVCSQASLRIPRLLIITVVGDKLQVRIKKGLIALPEAPDTPIICVGPGTGIAPVRAVIEERTLQKSYGEQNTFTPCRCKELETKTPPHHRKYAVPRVSVRREGQALRH